VKAKIEALQVRGRGVVIESETEEEKRILEQIWNTHGGLAVLTRHEGVVQLVVAPAVEEG